MKALLLLLPFLISCANSRPSAAFQLFETKHVRVILLIEKKAEAAPIEETFDSYGKQAGTWNTLTLSPDPNRQPWKRR